MAVRIRLQRGGMAHKPVYTIVAAPSSAPRDGKFIEKLGHYNPQPRGKEPAIKINIERADEWILKGAQPTDTVRSLLKKCRKITEKNEKGEVIAYAI